MAKPEVVAYLQAYLKKFPLDDLRRQLAQEGVSDADFDAALREAQKAPAAAARDKHKAGVLFLVSAVLLLIGGGLYSISRKAPPRPAGKPDQELLGESAHLGQYGYVVRLPRDYVAAGGFLDSHKDLEVVHFSRRGTDATNFLNEGLYGQLGIVRLEVHPDPLAGGLHGFEALAQREELKLRQRGEKYSRKNIQVSSLRGVQFSVESPFPRLETHILGSKVVYSFFAGQDDEIYRELVWSLRDALSES